ncbi:methyltransferase domain-containing protein [uncultured Fibrobacter sp.]|uniref:tRNA (guanine(46)-N(7))-methyltransferase TrmB n=1 Tax=uncultured Fibrobacter sp. TaxID=261512 RepID=UPI0025FD818B|nr:methyltransferase domain-containing protein [uncultured Fibrobacter sp.]
MSGARSVTSNQESVHRDLAKIVRKYARTQYMRPIALHTQEAFDEAREKICTWAGQSDIASIPVVLDSGCGTGESTTHLARRFPDCAVIGIDKSEARIGKGSGARDTGTEGIPQNAFWIRAELLDFWRLVLDNQWNIRYHAVFYPNPWPKQAECTRRFHMHPIFPTMMQLAPVTELRTNWEIYAQEFRDAVGILGEESENIPGLASLRGIRAELSPLSTDNPETAFERKYAAAGQPLWRVIASR